MNETANNSKWGRGGIVLIAVIGALLSYQFAYYLTYRSVVDSYGLGDVSFPDSVARPFFTPAHLLDEHLGLGTRIRIFSKSFR